MTGLSDDPDLSSTGMLNELSLEQDSGVIETLESYTHSTLFVNNITLDMSEMRYKLY